MVRRIMMGMVFLTAVAVAAGCSSTGVTTRTYVEDKERVDQDMSAGNYGYLFGKPVPENREIYKKTRKVYVLELTKEPEQVEEEPLVITRTKTVYVETEPQPVKKAEEPKWSQPLAIPSFDEEPLAEPVSVEPAAVAEAFVDYKVQKNDTLQKISKKFYDTYRKWPQIYEANKAVIKNPDRIKPGITLQIPVE